MKKRLLLVFFSFFIASSVIAEDKLNLPKKEQPTTSIQSFKCTPRKTCDRMSSCKEAYYHLKKCGKKNLDRDRDGIPCESICGRSVSRTIPLSRTLKSTR